MKEIKESKIRIKRQKKQKRNTEFDTLSITRELEKSLNIDEEIEKEKKKTKERMRKKLIKNILRTLGVGLVAITLVFFVWLNSTYELTDPAMEYSKSSSEVVVEHIDNNWIFTPRDVRVRKGIIIYPGEKTDPKSYSRLANMVAKRGIRVYVPKLRMNAPAFSAKLASNIIEENKDIKQWYLAAHSSSGEVALMEAANQKKISGVVFLGTYPKEDDLKLINKPVLAVWGTKDGILDFSKFNEYKANMPVNAHFYEIVGGNNTNFADIKLLKGDNSSIISPEKQQMVTAKEIESFIDETQIENVKTN